MSGKRTIRLATAVELGKSVTSALTFLTIASGLGPALYGEYILWASVSAVILPIATIGINWWIQPMARETVGRSIALPITITLLVGSLVATVSMTLLSFAFRGQLLISLGVGAIEAVIYPVCGFIALSYLAVHRMKIYMFISLMVPFLKLVLSYISFYYFGANLSIWILFVGSGGLVFLLCLIVYLGSTSGWRVPSNQWSWMRRGVSFGAVGAISATADNVDRITLAARVSPEIIGVYGAGAKLVSFALLPARSIALVVYPSYFELARTGNMSAIRRLAWQTVRRGLIPSLVASGAIIAVSFVLERTFMLAYENLALYVAILSLIVPLKTVQYAMGDVLYAADRPSLRILLAAISAGLSAGSILVFAGLFGAFGAAVAVVISMFLSALMYVFVVEKFIVRDNGQLRS